MEKFSSSKNELSRIKKKFSSELETFRDVEEVIRANRNRVYAHNDQEFHWFSKSYIESFGMTNEIYDRILEISDICIKYCNDILGFFNIKPIYEYSNHDDIKRLFGMQTEWDRDQDKDVEILDSILKKLS